jgi:hypothetical protein
MVVRIPLPTSLSYARNQTLVRQFAKANAANSKLSKYGPRATAQLTTPFAARAKFWRTIRFGNLRFACHVNYLFHNGHRGWESHSVYRITQASFPKAENCSTPGNLTCHQAASASLLRRNGSPNRRSNSRASSLLLVVVTSVIFMPCTNGNLSGFSSGKTNCSVSPML